MKTIETTVPVPAETLKTLVREKDNIEEVVVDLDKSQFPLSSVLIYLTNLGIDVSFKASQEKLFEVIKTYLKSPMLHDFRHLEEAVMEMFLQIKGYPSESGTNYHDLIVDPEVRGTITRWLNLVESLSTYMVKWIETGDNHGNYMEGVSYNEDKDLTGINFVKLIRHPYFPLLVDNPITEPLQYHRHFYNGAVFAGSTLDEYWTSPHNVLFMMTQADNEEIIDDDLFAQKRDESLDELEKKHV